MMRDALVCDDVQRATGSPFGPEQLVVERRCHSLKAVDLLGQALRERGVPRRSDAVAVCQRSLCQQGWTGTIVGVVPG